MGLRIGISRVAVVLKWGAIAWLALGALAFLIGLANKPASDLLLLDGLLFGLPGLIGLVLAYIVGGFATPDGSTPHRSGQPDFVNQANEDKDDSGAPNSASNPSSVPAPPESQASQQVVRKGKASDPLRVRVPVPASPDVVRRRRIGRFLAYGAWLALIVGVAILRGTEFGAYVGGELLVALLIMELVCRYLPVGTAPSLVGNTYIAAGAVVALIAMSLGFEQYRASEDDTRKGAAAFEQLGPLWKDAAARQEAREQEFQKKITERGLANLLSPATLLSPEANAASQSRVRQYKLLVDENQRAYEHDLSEMDEKFRALKGGPATVAANAYENTRPRTVALVTRVYAGERETADLILEVLSLMSTVTTPNEAEVRDGKIFFRNKETLGKYNALMSAIAQKTHDQQAATAELVKQQRGGAEAMQRLGTSAPTSQDR